MSYRRVIVGRWSRRDRLAVVVVAAITAVLVGTTLVVAAAGTTTTGMAGAADLETDATVTVVDDPPAVRASAPTDATIVPVARATIDGEDALVAGIPPDGATQGPVELTGVPDDVVRGPAASDSDVRIQGADGSVTGDVTDRTRDSVLPPWWYVASAGTVDDLGQTDALVVSSGADASDQVQSVDGRTVPAVGTLDFFVSGTDQLLRGVTAIAAGVGVLVAVVIISITRMTIRDRMRTIAVLRATGLPRWRVLGLFAVRATLLTAVAVAAGTAIGIVLTNAAVSFAVFAGVPTTLSVGVTPEVAASLLPTLLGLVTIGLIGGIGATLPTAGTSPAALHRRVSDGGADSQAASEGSTGPTRWLLDRIGTTLLDARAVVATAVTLSVFVAVVLLVTTVAGTLAPLAAGDDAAVLQDGATHPWSSSVDADYADALRSEGTTASPEILAFGVVDGEPFLVRGAEFDAFADLSGATIHEGGAPEAPDEAIVGRDLARSLGVGVGDRLPIGGTNRPAVTEVEITGVYRAPGFADDQLVVPLATARHLTNTGEREVNLVRIAEPPGDGGTNGGGATDGNDTRVSDVSVPDAVGPGEPIPVNVTVENRGRNRSSHGIAVSLDGDERARSVTLGPGERRSVGVSFDPREPGRYRVRVGNDSVPVSVREDGALRFEALPESGPPDTALAVRVVDPSGSAVGNASVTRAGANEATRTDGDGVATVALPSSGEVTLVASAPDYRNATHQIAVESGAERRLVGSMSVSPSRPDVLQRPDAELVLGNPWNASVDGTLEIDGPASTDSRDIALAPGERTSVGTTLERTGTGRYPVEATVDGRTIARTNYTVVGDDRVASAFATGERHDVADSGLGRAASHALGNLRVLLVTLVGLAGVGTVATTTAAFARTVHARRRTIAIHRSLGATPRQVVGRVAADATRVAIPATVLATAIGYVVVWALATNGTLTAFGVTLVPSPSPVTLLAIAFGALVLAVVAAAVAAVAMVRVPPARLFDAASGVGGVDGDAAGDSSATRAGGRSSDHDTPGRSSDDA